jgi:hypothetical protein
MVVALIIISPWLLMGGGAERKKAERPGWHVTAGSPIRSDVYPVAFDSIDLNSSACPASRDRWTVGWRFWRARLYVLLFVAVFKMAT